MNKKFQPHDGILVRGRGAARWSCQAIFCLAPFNSESRFAARLVHAPFPTGSPTLGSVEVILG